MFTIVGCRTAMDCGEDVVKLTYKQLKEMAERNSREEVADGMHTLSFLKYSTVSSQAV